jgi:hypothetical protein
MTEPEHSSKQNNTRKKRLEKRKKYEKFNLNLVRHFVFD